MVVSDFLSEIIKLLLFNRFYLFYRNIFFSTLVTLSRDMGASTSSVPPSKPIPAGKTRICMAAFPMAAHGVHVSDAIAKHFPNEYETWYYIAPKDEYYAYLQVRLPRPHLRYGCPVMRWFARTRQSGLLHRFRHTLKVTKRPRSFGSRPQARITKTRS
jgi:hypothetical protein